jgi:class 3 adenylate cyclase
MIAIQRRGTPRGMEHVERKPAAILAGDIAGYSRLTGAGQEGTIRRLRAPPAELIDPTNQINRGRTVKATGDHMSTTGHRRYDDGGAPPGQAISLPPAQRH